MVTQSSQVVQNDYTGWQRAGFCQETQRQLGAFVLDVVQWNACQGRGGMQGTGTEKRGTDRCFSVWYHVAAQATT